MPGHICFLYGLALNGKESCTKSASGLWEDLVSSSTNSLWREALHLIADIVGHDLPVLWRHRFFKTLVLMTVISQINYSPKGFPRLGSHFHRSAACPKSSHYAFTGHMQQKFKTQACLGFLSTQPTRGQQPRALSVCSKLVRDLGKFFIWGPCKKTRVSTLRFLLLHFVKLTAADFVRRTGGSG